MRESLSRGAKRLVRRDHDDHDEEIWALRDVSFEVSDGEALGVVGRNGAGKSTLLKVLTRITTPTSGRAEIVGRVGSLLEVGTGFHPELTGRENVYLNGSILGMKRREITAKLPDIVEFAGIEQFMDTPVKRYSSGMYVRLAFSVAAHLEPEIMLVDEVLAVGDAEFQRRCLGPDGGPEPVRADGPVRLAQHAVDRAALRSCDLDREGQGRGRRSERGRRRPLPSVGPRRRLESGSGPISSRLQETSSFACVRCVSWTRTRDVVHAVDVRRTVGIEIGFTVLELGEPVFPKIKVYDARETSHSTRWTRAPAGVSRRRRGTTSRRRGFPETSSTRALRPSTWGSSRLHAPKLRGHAGFYNVVSFHVQDPGEGDSAKGLFTGQLKGVVRPLLEWTTEER